MSIEEDRLVALLVDAADEVVERRAISAPPRAHLVPALLSLLASFPLESCHVVASLPRDYHIKFVPLPEISLDAIRSEAEVYLPYSPAEAHFSWFPLPGWGALVVSQPLELVREFERLTSLRPLSLACEAAEMSHLRLLCCSGLPGALLEHRGELVVLTALWNETCHVIWQQVRPGNGLYEIMERFMNLVVERYPESVPRYVLTNATTEWFWDRAWEARALPPDYLAQELALSPPGPHRFEFPAQR